MTRHDVNVALLVAHQQRMCAILCAFIAAAAFYSG